VLQNPICGFAEAATFYGAESKPSKVEVPFGVDIRCDQLVDEFGIVGGF
jgi:hypothetical protein